MTDQSFVANSQKTPIENLKYKKDKNFNFDSSIITMVTSVIAK